MTVDPTKTTFQPKWEPCRDDAGNVIARVDRGARKLEIARRVHGKTIVAILDLNTLQVESSRPVNANR